MKLENQANRVLTLDLETLWVTSCKKKKMIQTTETRVKTKCVRGLKLNSQRWIITYHREHDAQY